MGDTYSGGAGPNGTSSSSRHSGGLSGKRAGPGVQENSPQASSGAATQASSARRSPTMSKPRGRAEHEPERVITSAIFPGFGADRDKRLEWMILHADRGDPKTVGVAKFAEVEAAEAAPEDAAGLVEQAAVEPHRHGPAIFEPQRRRAAIDELVGEK